MPVSAESSALTGSSSAAAGANTRGAQQEDSRIAPGTTISSLDGLTVMWQTGGGHLTTGELVCIHYQFLSCCLVAVCSA